MVRRPDTVDTTVIPGYFSRLPVRIRKDKEEIHKTSLEVMRTAHFKGSKAYKRALYRQGATGPDLNFYALVIGEPLGDVDFDRMRLVIEFSEVLWAHDDATDEASHEGAVSECERLRRAMHEEYDRDPIPNTESGYRLRQFRDICARVRSSYPHFWPEIVHAMEEFLATEREAREWKSLEDYLEFRKVHCGNNIVAALVRLATNIRLTKEELAITKSYTDEVGVWYGLVNDMLSWKRERLQPSDRILNSVALLMKQYKIPENAALNMVRGLVVEQENKLIEMSRELRRSGRGENVSEYLDRVEQYAGGIFYWYLLAPRDSKPEVEVA